MTLFRYFPSIIFIITVLSVYILDQRKNFGWEAALFTCLIITTVGILGLAFLVPVSLALLLMLVTYYTFHYGETILYDRGILYMMLVLGIVVGYGLMRIGTLSLPEQLARKIKQPELKDLAVNPIQE